MTQYGVLSAAFPVVSAYGAEHLDTTQSHERLDASETDKLSEEVLRVFKV